MQGYCHEIFLPDRMPLQNGEYTPSPRGDPFSPATECIEGYSGNRTRALISAIIHSRHQFGLTDPESAFLDRIAEFGYRMEIFYGRPQFFGAFLPAFKAALSVAAPQDIVCFADQVARVLEMELLDTRRRIDAGLPLYEYRDRGTGIEPRPAIGSTALLRQHQFLDMVGLLNSGYPEDLPPNPPRVFVHNTLYNFASSISGPSAPIQLDDILGLCEVMVERSPVQHRGEVVELLNNVVLPGYGVIMRPEFPTNVPRLPSI